MYVHCYLFQLVKKNLKKAKSKSKKGELKALLKRMVRLKYTGPNGSLHLNTFKKAT